MAASQLSLAASIKRELAGTPEPETPRPPPEAVSLVDLEERILQLCSKFPKGITDDVIHKDQPLIDTERILKALNRLLSQGKIDLLKQGSTLLYIS